MRHPGAIYHVTHRGVEKRIIFEDTLDHYRYLRRSKQTVEDTQVWLYQFCLMPNQGYLVLETPLAGERIPRDRHFRQVTPWHSAGRVLEVVSEVLGVCVESLRPRRYRRPAHSVAA